MAGISPVCGCRPEAPGENSGAAVGDPCFSRLAGSGRRGIVSKTKRPAQALPVCAPRRCGADADDHRLPCAWITESGPRSDPQGSRRALFPPSRRACTRWRRGSPFTFSEASCVHEKRLLCFMSSFTVAVFGLRIGCFQHRSDFAGGTLPHCSLGASAKSSRCSRGIGRPEAMPLSLRRRSRSAAFKRFVSHSLYCLK